MILNDENCELRCETNENSVVYSPSKTFHRNSMENFIEFCPAIVDEEGLNY